MSAPYMQLYIADYLGDTQHLTTEQHGAYLLLLMAMWRSGGRLPNDPAKLARIARVSARRWHLIAEDIMPFFEVVEGDITQKRLEREHQKASSISAKRSASGAAGGKAKALKNNDDDLAIAKQTPQHHAPVPEPEPYISSETSSLRSAGAPDAAEKAKPERQLVMEELTAVVSQERAQAIVDHRKRIKAPLGAHAAKLLAKSLAKSQNPNSAADLMIERGWRGFDPSWGPAQSLAPAAPPPPPVDEDAQWRRKLKRWRETGEWNGHWGNHPETPGFQALCPKHILREFNLERPAA